MNETATCPRCGTSLPEDAPWEACPRCLLAAGLSSGTPPDRSAPPAPEEIAPAFPDLDVLEVLGQGGMGVVYKARQKKLDRVVALKVLPPEVALEPGFAERFEREARTLARLQHPNVVQVYDFGERDGLYYLLMEYVDGPNLRQALRGGHLAPAEALAIVPQICDALQTAHDRGVVHRDVKPENVLLDRAGHVKIADFGLAKILERQPVDVTLTHAGQVMGTLHYMAPEQLKTPAEVDHRADVYSLGVVFYEMLTGELPLGTFPPPSAEPGVDARLDRVVLRALERERDRRWQHASEVKSEVDAITNTPAPDAEPEGVEPVATAPSRKRGRLGRRLRRVLLVAGGLALAAGIAFLVHFERVAEREGTPVTGAVEDLGPWRRASLANEIRRWWGFWMTAISRDPSWDRRSSLLSPAESRHYARMTPEERNEKFERNELGLAFARLGGSPWELRLAWVFVSEEPGRARVVMTSATRTVSFPVLHEGNAWYPALGRVEVAPRSLRDKDRSGWLEEAQSAFSARVEGERVRGGPKEIGYVFRAAILHAIEDAWREQGPEILAVARRMDTGRVPGPVKVRVRMLGQPESIAESADDYAVRAVQLEDEGDAGRVVLASAEGVLSVRVKREGKRWVFHPDDLEYRGGALRPGDEDGELFR